LEFATRFCELLTKHGESTNVVGPGTDEPADVWLASGDERICLQVVDAFDENRRRRNRIAELVLDRMWTPEASRRYSGMSFCIVECGADTSTLKLTPHKVREVRASLLEAIEQAYRRTGQTIDRPDPYRCVEVYLPGPFRLAVHYSRYAPALMALSAKYMWVLGGIPETEIPDVFVEKAKQKLVGKYAKVEGQFWLLIYAFQNSLSRRTADEIINVIAKESRMPFDRVYVVCQGSQLTRLFPNAVTDHLPENPGVSMSASDCLPVDGDDRWRDALPDS